MGFLGNLFKSKRKRQLEREMAVQQVLAFTDGVVGFFGASSIERLPTEVAITGQVEKFKSVRP